MQWQGLPQLRSDALLSPVRPTWTNCRNLRTSAAQEPETALEEVWHWISPVQVPVRSTTRNNPTVDVCQSDARSASATDPAEGYVSW